LAPLGSPWLPLAPLGSPWLPLAPLGSPWLPLAHWLLGSLAPWLLGAPAPWHPCPLGGATTNRNLCSSPHVEADKGMTRSSLVSGDEIVIGQTEADRMKPGLSFQL
jgi:hypothetical protein